MKWFKGFVFRTAYEKKPDENVINNIRHKYLF